MTAPEPDSVIRADSVVRSEISANALMEGEITMDKLLSEPINFSYRRLSYLDLLRELASITRDGCDPECSLNLHLRESAGFVNVLLARPDLLAALRDVSSRIGGEFAPPG
ncbi:MAG: hypothetical protein WC054_00750 [Candidatus Nanopelagicales bacterium]